MALLPLASFATTKHGVKATLNATLTKAFDGATVTIADLITSLKDEDDADVAGATYTVNGETATTIPAGVGTYTIGIVLPDESYSWAAADANSTFEYTITRKAVNIALGPNRTPVYTGANIDPAEIAIFTAPALPAGQAFSYAWYGGAEYINVQENILITALTVTAGNEDTDMSNYDVAFTGQAYLTITPLDINTAGVTIDATADGLVDGLNFGAGIDAAAKIIYKGSAFTPTATLKLGGETFTSYEVSYDRNTNAYEGDDEAQKAKVTFAGTGNYGGEIVKYFNIRKAASAVTTAPTAKTLTYTGAAQALVNAGTVTGGTIQYKVGDGAYADAIPTQTNAGDYTVKYKVVGDENHNDFEPTWGTGVGQTAPIAVNIAKVNLSAQTDDVTTFYKGNVAPGAPEIHYSGFVNNETSGTAAGFAAPTITFPTAAAAEYVAGTYNNGIILTGGAATNYNLILMPSKLVINPAKVKIVAENQNKDFGTNDSKKTSWDVTYDNAATYIKVYVQNGELEGVAQYPGVASAANTVLKNIGGDPVDNTLKSFTLTRTAGNTVGEYVITPAGGETLTTNYEIAEYVTGTFTIAPAVVAVAAYNAQKTYGDNNPASYEYSATIGGEAVELPESVTSKIKIQRVAGEEVGSYEINFTGSPASEGGYTLNYTKGTFMINKKDLTIQANAQVLYTGDKVEKLDKEAVTFTGLVKNETINIDDINNVELTWAFNVSGNVNLVSGALNITSANNQEVLANGINIELKAGAKKTYLEKNYNILAVNDGQLTVINLAQALPLDDTDAALASKLAAANTLNKNITFSSRKLTKEVWNVLVLPFATSAKEVSAKLGYAVFNVLDTEKSDGDVHMKLWMGDIAANTPFLVKNYDDVELKDGLQDGGFGAKTIVYTEGADYINEDGNVFVQDGSGNQFIGVYSTANVWGAQYKYVTGKGVLKDAANFTEAKPCTIKPLRAYFKLASATARIFIEEPDGTITAIESVNADGIAVPAEGWYTVGGMKLQGAPTQKGIYVRNGKKIVVK